MRKSNKPLKLNKFNGLTLIFFYVLLYFLSNNIIYSQSLEKNQDEYLIPMGNILQIDAELQNIIVRNEIKDSPFKVGDAILKINEKNVESFNDLAYILSSYEDNDQVSVLIRRENAVFSLKSSKKVLSKVSFNNLISGYATLTYINPDTQEFGAVGHSINIGNTKKIPLKQGCISCTNNLRIKKSCRGSVGCINAEKNYVIGEFNNNTTFGIKGKVNNLDLSQYQKYKVADLNEVKLGKAQIILQSQDNRCKKYDIEIIDIEKQRKPASKGLKIKIIDKELLKETGGIVQGMSGTPIIQDNKIVGAVSHALENNPAIGYGVHIKWMLENNI